MQTIEIEVRECLKNGAGCVATPTAAAIDPTTSGQAQLLVFQSRLNSLSFKVTSTQLLVFPRRLDLSHLNVDSDDH